MTEIIGATGVSDRHPGYFTLLDRQKYLSLESFEEEYRKVFSKQWIFAGHISQLPEAGSYFVEELVGESVIVTRSEEGEVKAFLNVCRHRGHRVCDNAAGKTKRFVCGYHLWSYDTSGGLIGAPATPDGEGGVDYSKLSLYTVHVSVFHGLIFVCVGEERPTDLNDALSDLTPGIERFEVERTKEIDRETHIVRANWKTMLENYLECHHCAGNHPELSKSMDLGNMFEATEGWVGEYFGGCVPLKAGAMTASMDGQLMAPPLGAADPKNPKDVEGSGFGIVPLLTRVIVHIDHVVVHSLRPVEPQEIQWETRWYVRDDAEEGKDFVTDEVTKVWKATNGEDVELCSSAFKGVRSRRFVSGPIHSVREAAIRSALETYGQMMAKA